MNKTTGWILVIVITAAIAAVILFPRHQAPQQASTPVSEIPLPAPATEVEPLRRFPVPESVTSEPTEGQAEIPLPPLEQSDAAWLESLGQMFDPNRLGEVLIAKNLIKRLVVTIDNLPRPKLPLRHLPTSPPPDKFRVARTNDDVITIDPANYKRYARYVRLLEDMDTEAIVTVYIHFYPLFQQAYSDLGYGSAYFNDRLVEVLDHLLTTPAVTEPARLIQPSVFYKYADPQLESLSAGQKILIRIGGENAGKVMTKLRELRNALVTHRRG